MYEKDMEPLISKEENMDDNIRNKTHNDFFYRSFIYVFVYLLVGSMLYHFVFTLKDNNLKEASYIDCIYFTLVTLTTVGYGDYHPSTDWGKLFTCIYILFGVGFIAYRLSSFINNLLERQEKIVVNTLQKTHMKS